MATLTIDIPAGQTSRVLDAYAARNGYTGFLSDGATAQTKAAFLKQRIVEHIRHEVFLYESDAATQTVNTSVNNISIT